MTGDPQQHAYTHRERLRSKSRALVHQYIQDARQVEQAHKLRLQGSQKYSGDQFTFLKEDEAREKRQRELVYMNNEALVR